MGSLDIDSLFTKITLEGTIDIQWSLQGANTLFENTETVGLSKIEFKELLSLPKEEFISFLTESSRSKFFRSNAG